MRAGHTVETTSRKPQAQHECQHLSTLQKQVAPLLTILGGRGREDGRGEMAGVLSTPCPPDQMNDLYPANATVYIQGAASVFRCSV